MHIVKKKTKIINKLAWKEIKKKQDDQSGSIQTASSEECTGCGHADGAAADSW